MLHKHSLNEFNWGADHKSRPKLQYVQSASIDKMFGQQTRI